MMLFSYGNEYIQIKPELCSPNALKCQLQVECPKGKPLVWTRSHPCHSLEGGDIAISFIHLPTADNDFL